MLLSGILITAAAMIVTARMHAEERALEILLIAAMAIGLFLVIAGLIGILTEPPRPSDEFALDEEAATPLAARRPPSIATALGVYLFILAVIAGIVVGVAQDDAGAGIQTFSFGLILGGVIAGIGFLLGHRPVEE